MSGVIIPKIVADVMAGRTVYNMSTLTAVWEEIVPKEINEGERHVEEETNNSRKIKEGSGTVSATGCLVGKV